MRFGIDHASLAAERPDLVYCSLVAFGFSRLRFRGRDILFAVCISTMMLPGQVTMVPLYAAYAKLGWVDTFKPLIVPWYFGSAYGVFLMRQFFLSVPREIEEAAIMDGANVAQYRMSSG